jgi:L-fuconolactonase
VGTYRGRRQLTTGQRHLTLDDIPCLRELESHVIDAHHHVWSLGAHDYSWLDDPFYARVRRDFSLTDLLPELTRAGVERTVLVEAGSRDSGETADFLALAAESNGVVAGVVGTIDLDAPSVGEVLDAYAAHPAGGLLVGVRDQIQGISDGGFFERPGVLAALAEIADRRLGYDLVVRPDQLAGAVALARAVPQLSFVLDHLGKPPLRGGPAGLAAWRAGLGPLAALPNVTAKLSGLVTEADVERWTPEDLRPAVETALELFGPERVMFGSDWPVCLVAATYAEVVDALRVALPPLSSTEFDAVLGGTAERVYGLSAR